MIDCIQTTSNLLAVDGNNALMRCIKAAEGRVSLSSDEGIVTAPVFMFINLLSKFVKRYPTESVVVAWDRGHVARDEIYSGYKERRAPHDPEADEVKTGVFGMAKEFLSLAGVHHVEVFGVEADDIIATYWRKPWLKMVIVSGDKDILQLVTDDVLQVRPGHQTTETQEEWDADRVLKEFGCKSEYIPLVMALTGDSGDDVPGIPGYGNKTAIKHLAEYQWNLDKMLDNPPVKLAKVESYREIVKRNLKLVDLRNLPMVIDLPDPPRFRPTTMDSPVWTDLVSWLDQYNMETVKRRLINGTLWREDDVEVRGA